MTRLRICAEAGLAAPTEFLDRIRRSLSMVPDDGEPLAAAEPVVVVRFGMLHSGLVVQDSWPSGLEIGVGTSPLSDDELLDQVEGLLWTLPDDGRAIVLALVHALLRERGRVLVVIPRVRFPLLQYRLFLDMLERRFNHFGELLYLLGKDAQALTPLVSPERRANLEAEEDWTGRLILFVDCSPEPAAEQEALFRRFPKVMRRWSLSVDHQGTALRRLEEREDGRFIARLDDHCQPQLRDHHLSRSLAATGSTVLRYAYGSLQVMSNEIGPIDSLGYRIGGRFDRFRDRHPMHRVVAVTGGSAAFGWRCFHDDIFTQVLEHRLNSRLSEAGREERVTVLNFAISGHSILDEMRSLLLFAQAARPDVVLSHSGFNDFFYAPNIDPELLSRYAFLYCHVHDQALRLAQEPPDAAALDRIVEAFLLRVRQFAALAEATGAAFLFGLQPTTIGKSLTRDEVEGVRDWLEHFAGATRWGNYRLMLESVQAAYPRLRRRLRKEEGGALRWIDLQSPVLGAAGAQPLFFDPVHMTPAGHAAVAEAYLDTVLDLLPEPKTGKSSVCGDE